MSLKNIISSETPRRFVVVILVRMFDKLFGYLRKVTLGLDKQSFIGGNFRIAGSKHITFGRKLYILENAWIEAVTAYSHQVFAPIITIGDGFCSSPGLHITAISNVSIGDGCLFGANVFISDHGHGDYSKFDREEFLLRPALRSLALSSAVVIGPGCWLGNNVCVLGASIGSNTIVGANSVVTRNLPPNAIAVGAPAKVIKILDEKTGKWIKVNDE